jgi:uncharacterized membrane protein YesL
MENKYLKQMAEIGLCLLIGPFFSLMIMFGFISYNDLKIADIEAVVFFITYVAILIMFVGVGLLIYAVTSKTKKEYKKAIEALKDLDDV